MWAWAVLPAVLTVVILVFTPFPAWMSKRDSALSTLGIVVVVLPPFVEFLSAGVAFFHGWLPGIRVSQTEVRIGNCRGAERRQRKGRAPARVSPRMRTMLVEFAVPVEAVRSARVVEREPWLRVRLPRAWRGRREAASRRRNLAEFITPFARTVLELRVDLARAQLPELSPYIRNQFVNSPTSRFYVLTDRWTISTRRPAQLRKALQAAGIPVEQPSESLLMPEQQPTPSA